jgi:hypothetical protein
VLTELDGVSRWSRSRTDWFASFPRPTFVEAAGGTVKVGNRIQELGWLSPDADWDFSIDEIQFFKGTPPTGPVAN